MSTARLEALSFELLAQLAILRVLIPRGPEKLALDNGGHMLKIQHG